MASPYAPITQAGAGTTHVITGTALNKIRVTGFGGAIGTTGTLQFKSSGGAALTAAMNAVAGQPFACSSVPGSDGFFETASGEGLDVVSVTGAFNGWVTVQYVPG